MTEEQDDDSPGALTEPTDAVDPGGATELHSLVAPTVTGASGRLPRRPAGLERGGRLGRYVVLDELGEGGMGIVLRAYDPDLDRNVALKLLRPRAGGDVAAAQARLSREAQAVARLAHPNVVAVYEVGSADGHLYMAMELVDGVTLKAWCRKAPRSPREILAVFEAAGRGLAAAHKLGIVHRDFKPGNVIVGADGRTRVVDFGLARSVAEPEAEPEAEPNPNPNPNPDPDAAAAAAAAALPTLTRTGSIIGTPAYMAPEQHRGEEVTARCDQFSFCVALFEALYGKRPFEGDTLEDLVDSVTSGRMREVRAIRPRRLRRVLDRGLQINPHDRYPSMDALLADLTRPPLLTGARIGGGAAALALATWAIVATLRGGPAAISCTAPPGRLAGVWDEPTRAALRAASGSATDEGLLRLEQQLDAFAAGWRDAYREACAATRLRGEQSEQVLDQRMVCLHRRLGGVRALTARLAEAAGPARLDGAVSALGELARLDECADPGVLAARYPAPRHPAALGALAAVRMRVDEALAAEALGEPRAALPVARAALAAARTLQYPPIESEAESVLALLEHKAGDLPAAEASLRGASRTAAAAGDDERLAKLSIRMVYVVGVEGGRLDEAWRLVPLVEANVERAGNAQVRAFFEHVLASLSIVSDRLGEAREHGARAIAGYTAERGPEFVDIGHVEEVIGVSLETEGRYAEARPHLERAVSILERSLAPHHRDLGGVLSRLAGVEFRLGDHAAALAHAERAHAIEARARGQASADASDSHQLVGVILLARGETGRAGEVLEQVVAARAAVDGADSPDYGNALIDVGEVFRAQGKLAQAEGYYERGRAVLERTTGRNRGMAGIATFNIAEIRRAQGRCADALPLYEQVKALWQSTWEPDHPHLAYPDQAIGQCLLDLGRPAAAIGPLEVALARRRRTQQEPALVAESAAALALALDGAHREPARARALAAEAKALTVPPP